MTIKGELFRLYYTVIFFKKVCYTDGADQFKK
jgi:hypothetical protein